MLENFVHGDSNGRSQDASRWLLREIRHHAAFAAPARWLRIAFLPGRNEGASRFRCHRFPVNPYIAARRGKSILLVRRRSAICPHDPGNSPVDAAGCPMPPRLRLDSVARGIIVVAFSFCLNVRFFFVEISDRNEQDCCDQDRVGPELKVLSPFHCVLAADSD